MSAVDPRLIRAAQSLLARLALEQGLGVAVLPASPLPPAWDEALRAVARAAKPTTTGTATNAVRRPAPRGMAITDIPAPSPVPADNPEAVARQAALDRAAAALADCASCPELVGARRRPVFGEGYPMAELFFVGESPGLDDEDSGRPFLGAVGRLLTDIIEKGFGRPRDSVYLGTLVKCRPPQHRDPTRAEMDACRPILDEQIDRVDPRVVVVLGERAGRYLTGGAGNFADLRGRWWDYRGRPLRVIHHPAYIHRTRAQHGGRRTDADRVLWSDIQAIKACLADDGKA